MLKDYQKKIIDLLEQLETRMADLYRLFAVKYPRRKDLWDLLVAEETRHAEYIRNLRTLVDEGKVIFDEKMTKIYTVQTFIDNVKNIYAEVEAGKVPLAKALIVSNDFEQSIIERKFYDYFILKDPALRAILNEIKTDTFQHSSKINKALQEEKNRT